MVGWLLFGVLVIVALVALLVLVLGGLLGAFVGGVIGGVRGSIEAPKGEKELGAYRGITRGGCLGALIGLALTLLLLALTWSYWRSAKSRAALPVQPGVVTKCSVGGSGPVSQPSQKSKPQREHRKLTPRRSRTPPHAAQGGRGTMKDLRDDVALGQDTPLKMNERSVCPNSSSTSS
jgi:hypothetical protein